jgi:hypothetical protein
VNSPRDDMSPLHVHETSALQFLDSYVRRCSTPDQLVNSACPIQIDFFFFCQHEAWPSILDLIKSCLQLSDHPFTFLWLLGILQKFVHRYNPNRLEKRSQKDLQDVVQQLLQTCAMFAGQSIRFVWDAAHVVPLPAIYSYIAPLKDYDEEDEVDMPPLPQWLTDEQTLSGTDMSVSLIALRSLSNVLAIIIDDVWDDKERGSLILSQILPHLIPLLEIHTVENIGNVQAVSALLSSLSVGKVGLQYFSVFLLFLQFKYSVKAWRKDALNLFQKSKFFLMDLQSLQHWRFAMSRIVSQDKTIFLDLISTI